MPGIKRSPPQLNDDDVTTVVVKVADLSMAERLQTYQECFVGDVREVAKAISAVGDYQAVFYPVVEGTIKGARIRMIFSDPQCVLRPSAALTLTSAAGMLYH
ncbi:hypothetical protein DXG01_007622 [Tephrocybe rancida]|nr:hypothetical protein DXG01_007622 [Tephrocybe rancida]